MVNAIYFDGKSARPLRVSLRLEGHELVVLGEGIERHAPMSGLKISEPLGSAPRLVNFPDGAHCEVRDHAGFARLLHEANHRDSLVVRMQARWKWALAAVVLTVAAGVAAYRWGLPAVSTWLAYQLPPRMLAGMGESTLEFLDRHVLAPSNLTAARQQNLTQAFEKLSQPSKTTPAHAIVFRNGGPIGANAFALPDGTIVITDQLVSAAGNDAEILGVLSHELGHLEYRHSLRMLIQGSMVGAAVGWYLGDVSNIAAGLPAALLQARYSRGFEREADAYAAQVMKLNGISPAVLAHILERMQAKSSSSHPGEPGDPFGGYLDSHPATRERIRTLESAG